MKKGLVSIFCLLVLTLTALPLEAGAQTRYRRFDNSRRYEQRFEITVTEIEFTADNDINGGIATGGMVTGRSGIAIVTS